MEQSNSIIVVEAEVNNGSDVWTAEQRASFKKIKTQLKEEALLIRQGKLDHKNCQRGTHTGPKAWQQKGYVSSWTWRHKHIAYCLIKGRSYKEIENYVAEENKADMALVEKYRKEFTNA